MPAGGVDDLRLDIEFEVARYVDMGMIWHKGKKTSFMLFVLHAESVKMGKKGLGKRGEKFEPGGGFLREFAAGKHQFATGRFKQREEIGPEIGLDEDEELGIESLDPSAHHPFKIEGKIGNRVCFGKGFMSFGLSRCSCRCNEEKRFGMFFFQAAEERLRGLHLPY